MLCGNQESEPKAKGNRGGYRQLLIAIDGPAGSGKSTTARLCAKKLGFFYIDTGAMYRAVSLKVIEQGTNIGNVKKVNRLLRNTTVDLKWTRGGLRVLLDGRDVTREIRSPAVDRLVSEVSALRAVRKKMVAEQRRLAREWPGGVVCEGRDIGSVVFPNAQLKVFLDCAIEERARRREAELLKQEKAKAKFAVTRSTVARNLAKRDRIDSNRPVSPLRQVPDAVLVDTTHLTVEEQVAVVCALVTAPGRKMK